MEVIIHLYLLSLFLALNVQMIFRYFPSPVFFFLRALFTSLLFLVMTTFAQLIREGIMEWVGFFNVLIVQCAHMSNPEK